MIIIHNIPHADDPHWIQMLQDLLVGNSCPVITIRTLGDTCPSLSLCYFLSSQKSGYLDAAALRGLADNPRFSLYAVIIIPQWTPLCFCQQSAHKVVPTSTFLCIPTPQMAAVEDTPPSTPRLTQENSQDQEDSPEQELFVSTSRGQFPLLIPTPRSSKDI